MHWIPVISSFFNKKYRSVNNELKSYRFKFHKTRKGNILSDEFLKLENSIKGEMPDIVLVMTQESSKEDDVYRQHINSLNWVPSVLPLEIVPTSGLGNGTSMLKAFEYINDIKNLNTLYKKYPSLEGKNPADLNIVVLNVDGLPSKQTVRRLPFIFAGRSATPFDLSLANGIRASQAIRAKDKKGIVVMDAGSVYLGDFNIFGDITVLGSKASYNQILKQKLSLIIRGKEGKILKLYEKFKGEEVQNILAKKRLMGLYELDNKRVKQMDAFTGNVIFSFDSNEKYNKFVDFASKISDYLKEDFNENGSSSNFEFIAHFLIPLIMLSNSEDIYTFCVKLKSLTEDTNTVFKEDFYWNLFKVYNKYYGELINDLDINSYIPADSLFLAMEENYDLSKVYVKIMDTLRSLPSKISDTDIKKIKSKNYATEKEKIKFGKPLHSDADSGCETENKKEVVKEKNELNQIDELYKKIIPDNLEDEDSINAKEGFLKGLRNMGFIKANDGEIPYELFKYSIKQLYLSVKMLRAYGLKLSVLTVKLKNTEDVAKFLENQWIDNTASDFKDKTIAYIFDYPEEYTLKQIASLRDMDINSFAISSNFGTEGEFVSLINVPVAGTEVICKVLMSLCEVEIEGSIINFPVLCLQPSDSSQQLTEEARAFADVIINSDKESEKYLEL